MMKRAGKILTVVIVGVLGVWGCAKGPATPNGQSEKIRDLEKKCVKLEEDYRTVASARDDARKKATTLEEEGKRLQKQIETQQTQLQKEKEVQQQLVKDRNDLRQQMESRTNERDVLQTRCDRLKKGLQNLLGQDEAYLTSPPQTGNGPAVLGN